MLYQGCFVRCYLVKSPVFLLDYWQSVIVNKITNLRTSLPFKAILSVHFSWLVYVDTQFVAQSLVLSVDGSLCQRLHLQLDSDVVSPHSLMLGLVYAVLYGCSVEYNSMSSVEHPLH